MKQQPHDKHGIPIYAGDVLRTFHYVSRHYGRKMYLYHAVVETADRLEGVPVIELATGKADGGRFWLTDTNCANSEIVQGNGPDRCLEFTDRPKYKVVQR